MSFLRRYVFHDIGLKLFSLAMAVCLWAIVTTQDHTAEIPWQATIELHNMPQNLEVTSARLPETKLWLSGPSQTLDHLAPNSVHVAIDLSNAHPGERTFSLNTHNVHLPDNIEVKQLDPAQVKITLDARASRNVEVRPRVVGRLESGLAITKVTTDPPQVTIVGPSKRVNAVDAAVTDPVDATGLLSQHTFTVNAYVSDPLVHVVTSEPVRVTVFVGKSSPRSD